MYLEKCPPGMPISGTAVRARRPAGPLPRRGAASGAVRRGGSTITQQLARMLFFSKERTWGRKLRESRAALRLETQYSKSQILESYLNAVYLGHDGEVAIHGVGAASRHFLGKDR